MKLYIGIVNLETGTNVYPHTTEEGARHSVAGFCRDWWETELGDEPMPENESDLISQYFESVEGEWAVIIDEYLIEDANV